MAMTGYVYKSYSFTDKDPMIDYIRTIIQESHMTLTKISNDSGVSHGTIAKWLYGDTKRPQAASMNAVLRAMGYKLEVVAFSHQVTIKPTFLKEATVYKLPAKVKGVR
jgi:transcriptional regulator with XRE-family HTH domain